MKIASILQGGYRLATRVGSDQSEYSGLYAGDLLSVVMKSARPGNVLVTVMANLNAVAVASLVDLPAIIFCEGRKAAPDMIQRAESEGIALLETDLKAVDVIVDLDRRGLR
jgi:hypothetical protein